MTFHALTVLTVFLEFQLGERVKVGRLAVRDRQVLFEYDATFVQSGVPLSPLNLPLRAGVFTGDPAKFDGLMGVFDDSLPDGWGRLLIDRRAAKLGISPARLSPLDRLSLVGTRAMGALVYEPEVELETPTVLDLPELEADAQRVLRDAKGPDLDRLIALGGSPHGARPKLLVQIAEDGSIIYGDRTPRAGCTPWLIKFRSPQDDPHAATLERVYASMAAAAGVDVPESRLLCKTKRHAGYFAVRRFDRVGHRKLHLHTLAGLLAAPPRLTALSYRDLLLATRRLTRDEAAVREMFRRACFNVFAHNRDDHSRNFAFLMDAKGRWEPSPAYDLTFSEGPGGEHTLLVDDEGAHPGERHLRALAASVDLKAPDDVLYEVRGGVTRFREFAREAELPKGQTDRVARSLGLK